MSDYAGSGEVFPGHDDTGQAAPGADSPCTDLFHSKTDSGQWRQAQHLPTLPKTLVQTMTCEHQFHEWGHVFNPLFYQSRNQKKDIGPKQNTNYNSHISKYCSFLENYFPTVATVPSTWGLYIFLKSGHKDSCIVEEGYGLVSRFVK